jgi:hypothetical protein
MVYLDMIRLKMFFGQFSGWFVATDAADALSPLDTIPAESPWVALLLRYAAKMALRPREYDIEAIQLAASGFSNGRDGVLLRLAAYDYFCDCGEVGEARQALMDAERCCGLSWPLIPASCVQTLVFGNALLCRDAVSARQWWERLAAVKPEKTDSGYWLAKSALHWIESQREEAAHAWKIGYALAVRRPSSGGNEFGRDRFVELRRAIDQMPATSGGKFGFAVAAVQPLMMDKAESFGSAGPLGAAFCSE